MIPPGLRDRLYQVVFESDTPAGRRFDIVLLWVILGSVAVVVLESVPGIGARYQRPLWLLEWVFTAVFTVEYAVRLAVVRKRLAYATSLFGLVDLLAILPTWVALFLPGAQSFQVIRGLRLLRAFRILRMVEYVREAQVILVALRASTRKITVFLGAILTAVTIIGATMYVVEGPQNGFDSIPRAMYWAVVTLSTVGYGDISPKTPLGQLLASLVMMLGYSVLAVPTGIVTVEIAQAARMQGRLGQACPGCGREGHEPDARFCRHCGTALDADGGG
ncbi:ion transporter [Myxococcota bacterium]|nr:ion transporter [Myxococcota bacterium]